MRSLPFFSGIHSSEHLHNLCMQARASTSQPPEHSAEAERQQVLRHCANSVSITCRLDSSNVGETGKAKAQLVSMHFDLSSYAQHNSYALNSSHRQKSEWKYGGCKVQCAKTSIYLGSEIEPKLTGAAFSSLW